MADENGAGEEKKSPMTLIIILLVVVLLLGGGGVVGWMMLGGDEDMAALDAGGDDGSREGTEALNFTLETFVVNLNDPGGKRYLKTKIELEYMNERLAEELNARLPQLRDVILLLLSSKTLSEIQGIEGKIALRRELIMRINQLLKRGKVRNLYFTQFVIQ